MDEESKSEAPTITNTPDTNTLKMAINIDINTAAKTNKNDSSTNNIKSYKKSFLACFCSNISVNESSSEESNSGLK